MNDTTVEETRMALTAQVNGDVESNDKLAELRRLEAKYGQVWTTSEMTAEFEVLGFAAPFVVVKRRDTGEKGSLTFQHDPRLYFSWESA